MRELLVVANQTLAGHELMTVLKEKAQADEFAVIVVVPATPVAEHPAQTSLLQGTGVAADLGSPYAPEEAVPEPDAFALAEERLDRGIDLIRQLGCTVTGQVGDPDPMQAIDDVLARQSVDEVIVSTLPAGVSRWLRLDLPSRLRRRHNLPVTTVTASGPEGEGP